MSCECNSNESEKVTVVRGQSKILIVDLCDLVTGKPDDLTNATIIQAQFKTLINSVAGVLNKWRLLKSADTVLGSDIVTLDVTNIEEGAPISGPGIPLGATVLKTPTSTTSPSAPGTVKISANATANGTGVSLIVGDIEIIGSPILGSIRIRLKTTDTPSISSGSFFVRRVNPGDDEQYASFDNALEIRSP